MRPAGAQPQRRGARSDYASFVPWGLTLSAAGLGSFTASPARSARCATTTTAVCGRLLLPFLALLESSEQPQQRALMAELAARLYPHWQGSPESYLTDFITRHAIAPFWQDDLPISSRIGGGAGEIQQQEFWIDYAPAQRQRMIEEAFRVE